MDSFKLNIDKVTLERIERALKTAVSDAVKRQDIQEIGARGISMILLRTQRGKFLPGSKTPAAYSKRYAKWRQRVGLQTERVSLFAKGKINLLEAIRTRAEVSGGEIRLDIGYLSGLSEEKAIEIGGYLDRQGAGINHIIYHHIGFTDAEEAKLIDALRGRIASNLRRKFPPG